MKIREIRLGTGLSQSEFAKKYDIPVRTLQQWEQEASQPAPYVTKMLARLVELDKSAEAKETQKSSYISGFHIDPAGGWVRAASADYVNIDKIHPLQREKTGRLVHTFMQDKSVRKIMIFGSSVTDKCRIGSDIDVYVELADDHALHREGLDFDYDLWTNFTVDARLKSEIEKKGVTVYAN